MSNQDARRSGGGGGAGKASFQDFHFTTRLNKASPLIFKRAATGEHTKKAILFVRKSGGGQQDYVTIELTDVSVSSYKTEPHEDFDEIPMEQVSLNFRKIEFDYKPQLSKGQLGAPVHGGWDLKINKTV